ncbi:MAG TPA: hypothetical protein VJR89_01765 [Polyangiales bacterium]|nr:hypothetical protein [Polyangiales bacterium]
MSNLERLLEELFKMVGNPPDQVRQQAKRGGRKLLRVAKVAALMIVAMIVIPIVMISAGLLLGPRGVEGLIATPVAVLTAWAAILYFGFKKPREPRLTANTELKSLPAETESWLEHQRTTLPGAAQASIDGITRKLTAIRPQLLALPADTPLAVEARRLIGEELPELVRGYQKLPRELQRKPLHGGATPERRLIEGLATIDDEIDRLQARLAADDLHALATQQRYLEMKYKRELK